MQTGLFLNICRFLILFDIHLATLFSLKQNNFFLEHKLLPVHLTWLHLVYGKILFQPRHPHLMVSEENYTIYYFEFFEFVCAKYIKYNNCYVYITSLCLKVDVIAKDVMAYCQVTDVMVTLVLVADVNHLCL